MIEAGVVLGFDEEPLYWHTPPGRSGGSLPDSRSLWDVLWEHRDDLMGFAHTHPGAGVPGPSHTDLTTFAAVEAGLGVRLLWWIVSSDHVVVLHRVDGNYVSERVWNEPDWVALLRRLSETEG
jgi:hypothetical protein